MVNVVHHQTWIQKAEELSKTDLHAHPNSEEFFSYFWPDATLSENGIVIGKLAARIAYIFSCQWGIKDLKKIGEPTFEIKGGNIDPYVEWGFKALEVRQSPKYSWIPNLFENWIPAPKTWEITCKYKLYYETRGEETKIIRFETLKNDWEEE